MLKSRIYLIEVKLNSIKKLKEVNLKSLRDETKEITLKMNLMMKMDQMKILRKRMIMILLRDFIH